MEAIEMEDKKNLNMDNYNNYENEQLDPEQLDGVSGGYPSELSYDSELLSQLGLCQAYDAKTLETDEAAYQEVINAWEKVGVKVYASSRRKNLYKVNGKFGDIWTARKVIEEKLK